MYDQQLHNAWNDMNDAINDNKHGLGSEQYTRLINLMDTLANIGDDRAFELTNLQLSKLQAGEYITVESGAPKWSMETLKQD